MNQIRVFGLIVGTLFIFPTGAITGAMATEQIAARSQRANELAPDDAVRRQWSPLVQDIQIILRQLNLYDGPSSGTLDITTERAIQAYQRRQKIDADGLPTTELLRNMNGPGRAGALKSKLESARKIQISAARHALLKNPATRDLVGATSPVQMPDSLGPDAPAPLIAAASLHCERQPTRSCLLNIAVETATRIARLDYRDWANRDIIRTLARLGRFDKARNTIKQITDPRLTIVSLRETAVALAHGGLFSTAEQVARTIPDPANKARAFAAIAAEYARNLQTTLATKAAAAMQREFNLIRDTLAVADIATDLAVKLTRYGATPLSKSILNALRKSLATLPDDDNRRAVSSVLATAYARIGSFAEAQAILGPYGISAKQLMYLATVEYLTERGEIEQAIATINQLRQPRHYVAAMYYIAKAQAKAADTTSARATLNRALNAVPDIERPFAANIALAQIAEAWIYTADFANARKTMRKVGDHVLRARSYWNLAATARKLGFVKQAHALKRTASNVTDEIPGAFDRTATLIHATQLAFLSSQGDGAKHMFQRALREAGAIRGAWSRARIYARLAATLPSP